MIRACRGFVRLVCILGALVAVAGGFVAYVLKAPQTPMVEVGQGREVTAVEAMWGGAAVMVLAFLLLQVALQVTDRGGWPPPPGRHWWQRDDGLYR